MAHAHATLEPDKLMIGSVAGRLGIPALFAGLIALGYAAWVGARGDEMMISHFLHSYLTAYSFFMAITLGSLMFVMLHHLTRAGWSVTIRRLAEGVSLNMTLMVVLILPFFIPMGDEQHRADGVHRLFHWYHQDAVAADEILTSKVGYLNPQAFGMRMAGYFTLWLLLAWYFASMSARQDRTGERRISNKMERLAMPGMILFGFSLTAFAFDWIMSLNPHWFSTMFGVYYFAGAFLSAICVMTLLALALQKRGLLGNAITYEHYHDLGKWMFAFTFFWGYIAFSQYMLIWYAVLPEETQFYIPRTIGHWGSISLFLLVVHLLIPFPGLLSRHMKRKNTLLAFWAVWSLCACAVDQYWLIMPNQWINRIPAEVGNVHMPLQNALPLLMKGPANIYELNSAHAAFMENINYPLRPQSILITALCFLGIGGLYLFSTMLALRHKSLVPLKDPRLDEALQFQNI